MVMSGKFNSSSVADGVPSRSYNFKCFGDSENILRVGLRRLSSGYESNKVTSLIAFVVLSGRV